MGSVGRKSLHQAHSKTLFFSPLKGIASRFQDALWPHACRVCIKRAVCLGSVHVQRAMAGIALVHGARSKEGRFMCQRLRISLMAVGLVLSIAPMTHAGTVYTSDPNIADFTAKFSSYATFSNFFSGDVSSPFTPSASELATNGYRVY